MDTHTLIGWKAALQAADVAAWYLVLGLVLATTAWMSVWLHAEHENLRRRAGWLALVCLALFVYAMLLRPLTVWLLLGSHRPGLIWLFQQKPLECSVAIVAAPLAHLLALYAYAPELAEFFTKLRRRRCVSG